MFESLPAFTFPEALLLAPLGAACVWWSRRPARNAAALFSSLAELKDLPVTAAQRVRRWMPAARALGLGLLAVALARPQLGITETRVRTEGIAIQAALDISGSMEALDFTLDEKAISRIEAVKRVLGEFVAGSRESGLPGRPDDAIGLVAFGGFADSRCPLTLDHGALLEVIRSLETPKAITDREGHVLNGELLREEQATAIGDAIATSVERLKGVDAKGKVIVLLSDGVSNAGAADPEEAARIAQSQGIKIHSIGIGHTGVAPFPATDTFGNRVLIRQRVELDEACLKKVAELTGGRYFHARDVEALRKIYAEIDRLERSPVERAVYTEYRELYIWPLAAGLVLLIADGLLASTRFRRLPE